MSLLALNDDCLVHICSYLSIPGAYALLVAFPNDRMHWVVARRIADLKHWSISFRDPPAYNTELIEFIGQNLETISLDIGYSIPVEQVLQLLQPLCCAAKGRRLRGFMMHYTYFDLAYLSCLLHVAAQLTHLDLSCCQVSDNLLGPLLAECQNLRQLKIPGHSLREDSLLALKDNNGKLETMIVECTEHGIDNIVDISRMMPKNTRLVVYALGKIESQWVGGALVYD